MRLLVIEDEPDLRGALVNALCEEGYAVDAAGDGADGLAKAQTWSYDALVLDLMLPKLDGWEVLRRLRAEKDTPVLILTARGSLDDRLQGLNGGADDFLAKPFHLAELVARLRALIRRAAGQPAPEITIGQITVDTASRTVLRHGGPVALSAKEYALVEFMVLHRGKLVTRTMLYDHLFDEHDDSLSNLIDVYVFNVRKKLGREFITTRRGQGYIVNA